jgi:DNA polymerase I-like protein with 3'-5' exonuclease and polymerase domains
MKLIGFDLSDDPAVVKKINRNNTKRAEYAMIYGGGNAKLGIIAYQNAYETGAEINYSALGLAASARGRRPSNSAVGKAMREAIEQGITGFGSLVNDVKTRSRKTGKLRGIDGRTLWVRSDHSALNLILQSAGIIIIKKAMQLAPSALAAAGLVEDEDFGLVIWPYDELQYEVRPEVAERVGEVVADCITAAGEQLNFRCPLAGSYNVGPTWAETH